MVLKWLARRFLGHVEAEFFTRVENDDGKIVLKPTDRAKATMGALVQTALGSLKAPKEAGPPVYSPNGELDLSAVIGLVPKRYQAMAALAIPLLGRFLPALGGAVQSGKGASREEGGGEGGFRTH